MLIQQISAGCTVIQEENRSFPLEDIHREMKHLGNAKSHFQVQWVYTYSNWILGKGVAKTKQPSFM